MADSLYIDFAEMKKLESDLLTLSRPEKNKVVKQGFKAAADSLRDKVRANAPLDSGQLKKDIRSSATSKTGIVYILGGKLSPEKANWLEYGTSKLAPQPFIRSVFDANADAVEKLCIKGIITAIDKAFTK